MSSPDDRLDNLVEDVARAMTAAPAPDLAQAIVARTRAPRPRSPWLVPIAATVAVIAIAGLLLFERSGPRGPAIPGLPATPTAGRLLLELSASPGPQGPGVRRLVAAHPGATLRHRASRREPLPPRLVTDLTPAPIDVAPVDVPPIDQPADLAPAALVVAPLPVPPIDSRGGLR